LLDLGEFVRLRKISGILRDIKGLVLLSVIGDLVRLRGRQGRPKMVAKRQNAMPHSPGAKVAEPLSAEPNNRSKRDKHLLLPYICPFWSLI